MTLPQHRKAVVLLVLWMRAEAKIAERKRTWAASKNNIKKLKNKCFDFKDVVVGNDFVFQFIRHFLEWKQLAVFEEY